MSGPDIRILEVSSKRDIWRIQGVAESDLARMEANHAAAALADEIVKVGARTVIEDDNTRGIRTTTTRVGVASVHEVDALTAQLEEARRKGLAEAVNIVLEAGARYDGKDGPCGYVIAGALRRAAEEIGKTSGALSSR